MPDVYISRAGMENGQLDKQFESTEINNLQKKLNSHIQQNAVKTQETESLKAVLKSIGSALQSIQAAMSTPEKASGDMDAHLRSVYEQVSEL